MGSAVVNIPDDVVQAVTAASVSTNDNNKSSKFSLLPIISFLREKKNKDDIRKWIHSIKVGVALILVSLLYFLDPLYKEVGDDNAMWAIMTVVVIFEFYAGATLGKGLNRGIGTILGGGLGCLTVSIAQQVGGIGNSIIVGIAMLIFGGGATYCRLTPRIKVRYDYGAMIFILTFSLVALSGLRFEEVMEVARERLLMIVLGFVICIFTSLFVFPTWASDELHDSTVSKFHALAITIQDCLEDYFRLEGEKGRKAVNFGKCKVVLNSKSKDESLANFARWEPWHGKFGLSHPWKKYLKIGELLRELAIIIISLKPCLQSSREGMEDVRKAIKEASEGVGTSIALTMKELGESIKKMRKCQAEEMIIPKVKAMTNDLIEIINPSKLEQLKNNSDGLAVASFIFLLMQMVEKIEELAKEVEELGELAYFQQT